MDTKLLPFGPSSAHSRLPVLGGAGGPLHIEPSGARDWATMLGGGARGGGGTLQGERFMGIWGWRMLAWRAGHGCDQASEAICQSATSPSIEAEFSAFHYQCSHCAEGDMGPHWLFTSNNGLAHFCLFEKKKKKTGQSLHAAVAKGPVTGARDRRVPQTGDLGSGQDVRFQIASATPSRISIQRTYSSCITHHGNSSASLRRRTKTYIQRRRPENASARIVSPTPLRRFRRPPLSVSNVTSHISSSLWSAMAEASCSGPSPFKRLVDHQSRDVSHHQDRLIDRSAGQAHGVWFSPPFHIKWLECALQGSALLPC